MGADSVPSVVTVVIVDDHTLFAGGLQLLLESVAEQKIEVVGTTTRASEAEDLVRRFHPDLAIIDLAMPPPGGAAAIKAVKRRFPQVRVLALSGADDAEMAVAALAAGADGFVPKSADPKVVLQPMRAVLEGWGVLPRALLDYLVRRTVRSGAGLVENITDDERALWRLVAAGIDNSGIAERLFVSERTAKRLIAALLKKLNVSNRFEAATLAGRVGLFDEDEA